MGELLLPNIMTFWAEVQNAGPLLPDLQLSSPGGAFCPFSPQQEGVVALGRLGGGHSFW